MNYSELYDRVIVEIQTRCFYLWKETDSKNAVPVTLDCSQNPQAFIKHLEDFKEQFPGNKFFTASIDSYWGYKENENDPEGTDRPVPVWVED